MGKKSDERRKAKRQAMFNQTTSYTDGRNVGADGNTCGTRPARVQLVLNRMWQERVPKENTDALLENCLTDMRDGYRLVFPLLIAGGGAHQGVALVSKHDHRTRAIRNIVKAPGTTHVAVFLLFDESGEWEAEVKKFTRMWPEQSDRPEGFVAWHGKWNDRPMP